MDNTLPCEFAIHLGDGAFNSTTFVNGVGLPDNLKSNNRNNFADYLVSHLNLPFHYVGGNIDLTDYSHKPGPAGHDNDPFVLMKTYINETELNNDPYAIMRNGILFLAVSRIKRGGRVCFRKIRRSRCFVTDTTTCRLVSGQREQRVQPAPCRTSVTRWCSHPRSQR